MSIALYDLSNRPASFDFVTCMATARTMGADHVRFVLSNGFKKKNYTLEQAKARYKEIVEPAAAVWGMDYSIGEREGDEYSHLFPACLEVYREMGVIAKIQVNVQPKDYVTITLRNSRTPERNSKDDEWMKFASRLDRKAIILRDGEQRPLDLADRMKLYANAHMNFFVINGPVTLCIHSEAPYLCMRTIGCEKSGSTSPQFMAKLGITRGFQFPWANNRQRLSYLDDTVENIEREYALMESQTLRMAA